MRGREKAAKVEKVGLISRDPDSLALTATVKGKLDSGSTFSTCPAFQATCVPRGSRATPVVPPCDDGAPSTSARPRLTPRTRARTREDLEYA